MQGLIIFMSIFAGFVFIPAVASRIMKQEIDLAGLLILAAIAAVFGTCICTAGN